MEGLGSPPVSPVRPARPRSRLLWTVFALSHDPGTRCGAARPGPSPPSSSGGRLSRRSHLRPLTPTQIGARRLALQAAHQHRVHLVLHPGARADQLLAARQPPPEHAGALVGHPHRLKLAPPQKARQLAGVEPGGLGARLRDPGVVRRDHHHPRDVRLEAARHLPRTARDLHRHPVAALQAGGQRLNPSAAISTRPAERTTSSSQIATSQKSRCKSRPIARPVHLHKGCTCCTTNNTACRLRSPRRPLSRITRPYARGRTEPSKTRIFMPRRAAQPASAAPH